MSFRTPGTATPRRTILSRNQTLWTATLGVVGLLLAVWWIVRRDRGEKQYFVRIATYNCSLHRDREGALLRDLEGGGDEQARKIAAVIQKVRPDVLLLNEFDWDLEGKALAVFVVEYLGVGQRGQEPIQFPFTFAGPVNTGVASGCDLDNDGSAGGPGDGFGFGLFPGQYGMALLSRYRIDEGGVRTFGRFLWKDMPGARLPPGWFEEEELAVVRLSSKNHWDVPVDVESLGITVHFLASHPTPPVFDGEEDLNGRRNADEIRLWVDYLDPERSGYLVDDRGVKGGLAAGERFVLLGDLNADPEDGDGVPGAIEQLLEHPAVARLAAPHSVGGEQAAHLQWGANSLQKGDAREDTGDFGDDVAKGQPGNLRLDYVLVSKGSQVADRGVFWPAGDEVGSQWMSASDHRLVWLDLLLSR